MFVRTKINEKEAVVGPFFLKKMNLLKFDVIVHAGTSIKSGKMPQTVDLV